MFRFLITAGFLYLGSIAQHVPSPVAAPALLLYPGMPIPPSRDPWYRVDDGLPASNGDVIKVRTAPGNLTSILSNLARCDQILYRTLDALDSPTWAVTTVLVPKTADPEHPAAVSYQVSQDSACLDTSPSYLLSTADGSVPRAVLDGMLLRGWHVIVPDHEGPLAAFGAGKLGGRATLDSVRAVHSLASSRYGLNATRALYAAWGYSGGALATAWACREAAWHAPDLGDRLTSFVVGGLPADLPATLRAVDGTLASGLAVSALSGLMSQFPRFNETVRARARAAGPRNVTAFDRVKAQTLPEALIRHAGHNMSDYFEGGLDALLRDLRAARFDAELDLLKVTDVRPLDRDAHAVLAYHAVDDEIAPIGHVDRMVDRWCSAGHRIEFHRIQGGGHLRNADDMVASALDWLAQRFASEFEALGQERIIPWARRSCKVRDVSNA